MVQFYLMVRSNDEKLDWPTLYKKEEWPVLPREGEWWSLNENILGAAPVEGVWHGERNKEGHPMIMLEFSVDQGDYDTLAASPEWSEKNPIYA